MAAAQLQPDNDLGSRPVTRQVGTLRGNEIAAALAAGVAFGETLLREGLIIACAALYPIAESDCGELACLAVNPDYRHGGRGDELLERIEARAREQGI